MSSTRQGQARKTFRKARERRRSQGGGKGRREAAREVRIEVTNAISSKRLTENDV